MPKGEHAKRVVSHLENRMKKNDALDWNQFYTMERLAAKIKKTPSPKNILESVSYINEEKLLASLVSHPDAAIRAAAVSKLKKPRKKCTREALQKAIEDKDPGVRKAALFKARGLVNWKRAPYLVGIIEKASKDPDPSVKKHGEEGWKIVEEQYKPYWKKLERFRRVAKRVVKALLPTDVRLKRDKEALRIGEYHLKTGMGLGNDLIGANFSYILELVNDKDNKPWNELLDKNPKLEQDVIEYAKALYDLTSVPYGYENDWHSGFEFHSFEPHEWDRWESVQDLADFAVHRPSPEAVKALQEMYSAEDAIDLEKDTAALGMVAAHEKVTGKTKIPLVERREIARSVGTLTDWTREKMKKKLEKKKAKKARGKERSKQITAQQKLLEHKLPKKKVKEITSMGDAGVEASTALVAGQEISPQHYIELLGKIKTPYAASVLWDMYANLSRMGKPRLSKDWKTAYGKAPDFEEERMRQKAHDVNSRIKSLLGGGSEGNETKEFIGEAMARMDTAESLKPLLAVMGEDRVAMSSLSHSGDKGTELLREIAKNEKEGFKRRAAAIQALAGKKDTVFLKRLFNDTGDAHVKALIMSNYALTGHHLGEKFVHQALREPEEQLDKKTLKEVPGLGLTTVKGFKGQYQLKTTHELAAALLGHLADREPLRNLVKKYPGKHDLLTYALMVKNRTAWILPAEEARKYVTRDDVANIIWELATAGETRLGKELSKLAETHPNKRVKMLAKRNLASLKDTSEDMNKVIDSMPKTGKGYMEAVVKTFKEAITGHNYRLFTYTPPDWVTDTFKKELGIDYCRAHNQHQWAIYAIGAYAMDGNTAAVELLKEYGLKAEDEHTRKMSKTILDHIKERAKKQKAITSSK